MTLQRYLTRLIWLTVLPVLGLALGLSYLHFARERDDDGVEAQQLATALARELDQLLQARIGALQMLARSPLLEESRWRELHGEAQGYRENFGGHVIVVDAQRRMRLHTGVPFGDELPPLPRPAGRAAVPLTFELARSAVGDPFQGPIARETQVAIAVPVVREGQVPAVLAHLMPVRQLEALLDQMPVPAAWIATLHDSQGKTILRRGGAGGDDGANGDAMLRFTDRASAVPWTVQVRIPLLTYAQHVASVGTLLAMALLAVTLISVLAGRLGTRRLKASVRALVALAPADGRVEDIEEIREARRVLDEALAQREAVASALQLREEQLRRIFESASEAIITVDAEQRIVLANPEAAHVFGRPLDQMIGTPLAELIPVRLRARHREEVEAFGRSGSGSRSMSLRPDVAGLRADGSEFPIEAAISQVRAGDQRLYTVILRDVSERRRVEATIVAAKARLEATLESMSDALAMVDVQEHIVELNTAFVRMYGFADKAQCPRSLQEFERILEVRTLDGELVPIEQWSKSRALRGETGTGVEMRLRRTDIDLSWIASFSFAPILDAAGHRLGAVITARDVTEQRRLEEDLRQSHAELARLVAAQQTIAEEERKRIARELHDELQQVLAAIKMDVAAIESELAGGRAGAPALLTRIDDLATAAIVSSRRIVNDLRPLLLEELGLLPALEALAHRFAERSGLVVKVVADERSRAGSVLPDAIAICLYRAVQEALNNVLKHAGAARVQIALGSLAGGGWRLAVSDDGRGLRPEDRRKPMSYGLRGIAERVRALGGTLQVEGAPGRGVTLVVEIGTGNEPHEARA